MNLDELDRLHAAAAAGEWMHDERDLWGCVQARASAWGILLTAAGDEPTAKATCAFTAAVKNTWPEVSARLRAAEAESARLRRHYDAAAPEHNLLALLDLYEERRREAVAEVERLRGALVAKGDRVVHRLTKGRIRGTVIRVMAEVAVDGVPRPVMSPLEYDVENLEREPAARAALGET